MSNAVSVSETHRPLHVLVLTPFYPTAENEASGCFIADPVAHLNEFDVTSSVMGVRPIYRGRVHANLRAPAAAWAYYLPVPSAPGHSSSGKFLFAAIARRVGKLHQSHPVDLIHAHSALPCGRAAELLSRRFNIPFVVTVHGLDAFSTSQVKGLPGRWCRKVSERVYRSARRVICISRRVCDQVVAGCGDSCSTSVVYNGVDPNFFSPAPDRKQSQPILLAVGNLIPIKGHELLLRAFAAVQSAHPELGCEIIGEGPERGRLEALASNLSIQKKVRFLGWQSRAQVAEAMRRCALFALPSRYEGLGCVYLEAMAGARPVIGCTGQGIDEVVESGVNGLLVAPGNLQQLTDALAALLADPALRSRLGQAGRQTILERFTVCHQAEQLAGIYRECTA